ncbi:MAG: hypothetical protein P4L26_12560 [Terracidiphilus sp.]|nr:hypothetical protein [Terracidiphilus sp.]
MKTSRIVMLAITGIASPLLLLLALENDGSKLAWLLFGPGRCATNLLPKGISAHYASLSSWLAFALDFVLIWAVLSIVAVLIEKLIYRRKEHA